MNQFLEGLKSELTHQHLTQKDLAEKSGISVNTIRGWFSKDLIPDTLTSLKVADVLGVSVEYLVTGKDSNHFKEKYETLVTNLKNLLVD